VPQISPPLGAAVPASPHATVVSLPTLADVEGYERKDPATWRHISQGYPRFVRHRFVAEAAARAAAALGRSGELFPLVSRAVAERLARRAGAPVASLDAVADWWLLATPAGDAATRLAKFVQHTGALISSRQADAYLAPERRHVGAAPASVRRALAPYLAGVAEADVLLATSGMNAVDAALAAIDALQRPRGRRAWIQLGWLYVDSARLLEKAEDAPRHFVADVRDLAAVERLLAAGDVAGVCVEIPNNPQLETADVPALRALCDRHGAMLLLDPSSVGLATVDVLPWADVLCCSLTKYAAADGDVMAGVLAVNPARPDAGALLAAARARLEPLHPLDTAALAAQVDFLVVITPGGAGTRHLIDAKVLQALGPRGFLVNVARGSVVDEAALVQALQAGTIAGAGLDVFADEPNVPQALWSMSNVVLTPHMASATHETRQAMADLAFANMQAGTSGAPLRTPVPECASR